MVEVTPVTLVCLVLLGGALAMVHPFSEQQALGFVFGVACVTIGMVLGEVIAR